MHPTVKKIVRNHLFLVLALAVFNIGTMGIKGMGEFGGNLIPGLFVYGITAGMDVLCIGFGVICILFSKGEDRQDYLRRTAGFCLGLLVLTLIYWSSCYGPTFIGAKLT